jgi:MFS family permease
MGCAECIRGILAFFACPLFGILSDKWGRRPCLLVTVLGTLAPVCSLAFWKVGTTVGEEQDEVIEASEHDAILDNVVDTTTAGDAGSDGYWLLFGMDTIQYHNFLPSTSIHRIDVFVILFALSGVFASTFTLTFAYISDVVKDRDGRVAAYGLALATFGLSFTVGPLLGGYFANVDSEGKGQGGRSFLDLLNINDNNDGDEGEEMSSSTSDHEHEQQFGSGGDIHPIGQHRVFVTTLVLAVLDLFYIHFILPESLNHSKRSEFEHNNDNINLSTTDSSETVGDNSTTQMAETSSTSNVALPGGVGVSRRASSSWWNPWESIRYLTTDPLLRSIGRITFFYYTALHAVVSTLILYAARQFHLGPHRLGELMAALGLSTMLSEAVLVRIAIPALGEPRSMRVGLASFTLQCVLLAVAGSPWHLFMCAVLAVPGNLVYPSISSLVSTSVQPEMVGRALGAVNGVKSLTEGVGPLLFGMLLTISEHDSLPGWPYFIAAIMAAFAWHATRSLSDEVDGRLDYYMRRGKIDDYDEMEPLAGEEDTSS